MGSEDSCQDSPYNVASLMAAVAELQSRLLSPIVMPDAASLLHLSITAVIHANSTVTAKCKLYLWLPLYSSSSLISDFPPCMVSLLPSPLSPLASRAYVHSSFYLSFTQLPGHCVHPSHCVLSPLLPLPIVQTALARNLCGPLPLPLLQGAVKWG